MGGGLSRGGTLAPGVERAHVRKGEEHQCPFLRGAVAAAPPLTSAVELLVFCPFLLPPSASSSPAKETPAVAPQIHSLSAHHSERVGCRGLASQEDTSSPPPPCLQAPDHRAARAGGGEPWPPSPFKLAASALARLPLSLPKGNLPPCSDPQGQVKPHGVKDSPGLGSLSAVTCEGGGKRERTSCQ